MKMLNELVVKEFPRTVTHRQWLHAHAEMSFEEYETSDYIEEQLSSLEGLVVSRPTPTSVLAVLNTGRAGRTLAIRADIDALPIHEDNDLPYKSINPGVMHACGHDGHAAALLSTIHILHDMRDELTGEIRFVFQHAEEAPPGGGIEIIRSGVLEGVDACFGLHFTSTLPTGKFGVCSGVLTSATDRFDIEISGKGGHSSMPQECADPIIAGCQTVLALQTVLSRNLKPADVAVLSVCKIESGSAYNIIPGALTLTGSVRTFDEDVRKMIQERIEHIATSTCAALGTTAKTTYTRGYDSVYNLPSLTQEATKIIVECFGDDAIIPLPPIYPGDDYCYYSQAFPSFFVEVGSGCKEKGTDEPHHNAKYRMDEDALLYSVEYMCALLLSRCKSEALM